jgi:hypothetical protein
VKVCGAISSRPVDRIEDAKAERLLMEVSKTA